MVADIQEEWIEWKDVFSRHGLKVWKRQRTEKERTRIHVQGKKLKQTQFYISGQSNMWDGRRLQQGLSWKKRCPLPCCSLMWDPWWVNKRPHTWRARWCLWARPWRDPWWSQSHFSLEHSSDCCQVDLGSCPGSCSHCTEPVKQRWSTLPAAVSLWLICEKDEARYFLWCVNNAD